MTPPLRTTWWGWLGFGLVGGWVEREGSGWEQAALGGPGTHVPLLCVSVCVCVVFW
jgi:hypothetical protein